MTSDCSALIGRGFLRDLRELWCPSQPSQVRAACLPPYCPILATLVRLPSPECREFVSGGIIPPPLRCNKSTKGGSAVLDESCIANHSLLLHFTHLHPSITPNMAARLFSPSPWSHHCKVDRRASNSLFSPFPHVCTICPVTEELWNCQRLQRMLRAVRQTVHSTVARWGAITGRKVNTTCIQATVDR